LSNIFRVQTAHGTVLAFDLVKGRIVHRRVSEVGTDYPTALLYIPEQSPSLAFLLADNPNAIPVAPSYEEAHGPILTLKRHRLPPFATYAFRHSHRQEYLLTRPELEVDGSGIVAFYAIEPASWEECHLIGSADLDKAGSVQTQIAQIQLAYDAMPDGILSLLRQTPTGERRQLAYLLGSMLDSAGAERLGAKLLSEPALNVEVAGWLPDDPWVNTALPDLREFLRKRDGRPPAAEPLAVSNSTAQQTQLGSLLCGGTPALQTFEAHPACVDAHVKRSIGIHFDRIASAGFFGEYASIMQQCNAAARRQIPPTKDLCIVATARNEGLYLIEWIAYHKSIGVDHVFIYTNGNEDGSGALLQVLAEAGEITLIESTIAPGGSPQGKAYAHALGMLPDVLDYRWCGIIDIDEFISFDRHMFTSLKDYIAWQELRPVDAIALNWVIFGSAGASRWQDEPMPYRFQHRIGGPDAHLKTILRPRLFHHSHAHVPKTGGDLSIVSRDARGELSSIRDSLSLSPKDEPAWIAHYFFRSAEEFALKFSRGRGDIHLDRSVLEFHIPETFMRQFIAQQHAVGFRDGRTAWCAEGMPDEIARLLHLPGVSETRSAVLNYYRHRSSFLETLLSRMRKASSTLIERQMADAFFESRKLRPDFIDS
jgi:hypothetical protein